MERPASRVPLEGPQTVVPTEAARGERCGASDGPVEPEPGPVVREDGVEVIAPHPGERPDASEDLDGAGHRSRSL
jgi:hypothetical protein